MGVRRPRRARHHSQKVPKENLVCVPCGQGDCIRCVNLILFQVGGNLVCTCEKLAHIEVRDDN